MPFKDKIIGVYQITVKGSIDYIYVGHSINCKQRYHSHKVKLRQNKHSNPILQRLWNKYGIQKFEFKIVERNIPKEQLHIVEQKYIDLIPKEQKINIAHADRHHMSKAIRKSISEGRKKAFKEGTIDMSNCLRARKEFDKKRNQSEVYSWTYVNTGDVIVRSVEEMAFMKGKTITQFRSRLRNYRSKAKSCKTKDVYGYIINGSVEE